MIKFFFRIFTPINVWLYRHTDGILGGWVQGLPVLLLTTTGRKTGRQRTTGLGYLQHDGAYVITASNGGLKNNPAWYYNLKSHPQVELQIRGVHLTALAEQADPALRQQLWPQLVKRAPGYGLYQKFTAREIPMLLLRPVA